MSDFPDPPSDDHAETNKGGRPKKPVEELKRNRFTINLSDLQVERIEPIARSRGMSLREFAEACLLARAEEPVGHYDRRAQKRPARRVLQRIGRDVMEVQDMVESTLDNLADRDGFATTCEKDVRSNLERIKRTVDSLRKTISGEIDELSG